MSDTMSLSNSEWRKCELKNIAEVQTGPFGSQLKNEQYITGGTPVITVEHINNFRIDDFDYPSITDEDKDRLAKYLLKSGDIVFTRVGSVDLSAFVQPHHDGWMFSSRMLRVRPISDIDSRFLSYFFQQKIFREYILNIAVGATMPSINTEILKGIPVSYPPLPEQKAIAEVLSSLDDKINLLHRQNKTLEQMAETLFRQWFVEEAGEDWEEGVVSDLIDFNPRRILAKGTIAPYLDMASLNTQTFNPDGWYDREYKSGTKFINEDTLLARITPCLENGKTAYVTFLQEKEIAWGSTEYIVMRPKEGIHPFFAYTLARNSGFRDYAEGCLAGSSGRQRIDLDHLKNFDIPIPPNYMLEIFNDILEDIVPKLGVNAVQISTLENLRNTLLPKLMNGEIRIASNE
jgi:type I restriction enzyme S subunit